ncbi:MAG TPA: GNAT family N-acetyltransferase [Stellaceae bacterium]
MASVVIRPAVEGDAPAIARIVHDAFAGFIPLIGRAPRPMFDDYNASVAQGDVWVLTEDDAIAGAVVLEFGDDHLLAPTIAIAPSRQSKGHGRRLVDFIEAEARRRGYSETRLRLHASMSRSIAFYKAQGYAEYCRDERDGYLRVYMRKRLTGTPA